MRFGTLAYTTLAACATLLAMSTASQAQIQNYIFSATGSGSLGSSSFSNSAFTINATGDTSLITSPSSGLFFLNSLNTTVTIIGVGSATFTAPTNLFDNQSVGAVGISGNVDILDNFASAATTYNLASPIGPITGSPFVNSGRTFGTSAGDFVLQFVTGNVTFQASRPAAVPEPGNVALLMGLATTGAGILSRRRRPQAHSAA